MRAILIATLLTLATSTGFAQDPVKGRVIDLAPTVVNGTPQRPGAFYVMARTRTSVGAEELRTSFIQQVVRSAQRAPLSE